MTNCSELLHKHISAAKVIYSLPHKPSLRDEQQMVLSIRTLWLQWHKTPDRAVHCTSKVLFITDANFQNNMKQLLIDFPHSTVKSWMFVFLKSTYGHQKVLFSFDPIWDDKKQYKTKTTESVDSVLQSVKTQISPPSSFSTVDKELHYVT